MAPDEFTITFDLPVGAQLGQEGTYGFRLSWEEDGVPATQSIVVDVHPGMSARDIATHLEAAFLTHLPNNEITATQNGVTLVLSPKAGTQPVSPVRDVGPFAAAGDIPTTPVVGDWGRVTNPLMHGTTPVPAGAVMFYVGSKGGWIIDRPTVTGGITFDVQPGGNPLLFGAISEMNGATDMTLFEGTNSYSVGDYILVEASYTFPAPDPTYPLMGSLTGVSVDAGDLLINIDNGSNWYVAKLNDQANNDIRTAYANASSNGAPETVSVAGTVNPAQSPPADWQEPGTSPHHVELTDVVEASMPSGPVLSPVGGGWRYLNREIWQKNLKSDPDQVSDEKDGDLQVTLEQGHRELKAYSEGSAAWIPIFSEAEVKEWIAAGSQFQGTVQNAGHGTAGAIDMASLLPQATLTSGDKSHYWIWVGTPGHSITANDIGGSVSDIDGAVLSVGDWIIVAEIQPPPGSPPSVAPTYAYRVIPGDLMSRSLATQMFGLHPWTQGGWPEGSVVSYKGDVYRADQPILATDPAPDDAASPWVKVDISGGLKIAPDDSGLPNTAPPGQVWIVLSSGQAGGTQALYGYDAGALKWEPLGGSGGQPIDLNNGTPLINMGVPVGTIIDFAGNTIPDGWLKCDGSVFDPNTYPEVTRCPWP